MPNFSPTYPRRNCPPKPPTVVATQNNVRFNLVFKDTYVFTGGINGGGWLLKDSKDAGKGWFTVGLVIAPPTVVSSLGPDGHDFVLQHHDRYSSAFFRCSRPIKCEVGDLWTWRGHALSSKIPIPPTSVDFLRQPLPYIIIGPTSKQSRGIHNIQYV